LAVPLSSNGLGEGTSTSLSPSSIILYQAMADDALWLRRHPASPSSCVADCVVYPHPGSRPWKGRWASHWCFTAL